MVLYGKRSNTAAKSYNCKAFGAPNGGTTPCTIRASEANTLPDALTIATALQKGM